MKRLLVSLVLLAAAGCTMLFAPADAPATINRGHWLGRQVMFTFDARESDIGAAELLDKLRYYRVPAAFFVTGQFVEQHPALTRRIAAEGHEVYNHSYSNPLLRHAPEARIVEQLRRADAAIVRATGRSSKPFFRPAYGEIDENLRRVAFAEGYRVVRWTISADDWKPGIMMAGPTNLLDTATNTVDQSSASARERDPNYEWIQRQKLMMMLDKDYKPPDPKMTYASNIVNRFQSGAIVLLHVGYTNTVELLEPLIKVTRGKDYNIVPLRDGVK
jgi:peptidoglycan/xylan/chitin deacetylase (PgdA/CDA1 family)